MILRDYLETIIVPPYTTIEVIDNTGSMISYVKLYTFSSMEAFFKRIKQYLDNGKLVCYSGTPCQVGGLRAYLRKDYENLILVDIMCHSVPSPLVFEKYKRYIFLQILTN